MFALKENFAVALHMEIPFPNPFLFIFIFIVVAGCGCLRDPLDMLLFQAAPKIWRGKKAKVSKPELTQPKPVESSCNLF